MSLNYSSILAYSTDVLIYCFVHKSKKITNKVSLLLIANGKITEHQLICLMSKISMGIPLHG